MEVQDKLDHPLHDDELEALVCGIVLRFPKFHHLVSSLLTHEVLFRRHFRLVFQAFEALRDDGRPLDAEVIRQELKDRGGLDEVGPAVFASLLDKCDTPPTEAAVRYYAGRLHDLLSRRRLREMLNRAAVAVVTEQVPLAESTFPEVLAGIVDEARRVTAPVRGLGEPLDGFLASSDPHTAPLIQDLIPGDGVTLLHGQPRDYKTWVSLELAVAVATGTSAFFSGHLVAGSAASVLYITEEDSPARLKQRMSALLKGRDAATTPSTLHISAAKGLSVDDRQWQRRIIEGVARAGHRLVVFDPLRSITGRADQGPAELQPVARFLRQLMRETGCAVALVHHDVKPQVGHGGRRVDDRALPHRASGGGIFSIADNPIHLRRVGEGTVVLTPAAFKFSADPDPVVIRFTFDDPVAPTWVKLVADAVPVPAPDAAVSSLERAVRLRDELVKAVRDEPGLSSSDLAKSVGRSKEGVLALLKELVSEGKIRAVKEGRAMLHYPCT